MAIPEQRIKRLALIRRRRITSPGFTIVVLSV